MSEIVIRTARPDDAADLKALLDRSWRTHWAPHVDAGAVERYNDMQPVNGYLNAYLEALKVAVRDGVIVGMYHLDRGHLYAIHVDSWAIGTGVGRALMAQAEAEGARELEVRAFNERARNFYRGRGWIEVNEYADTEMGFPVRTIAMERA